VNYIILPVLRGIL